MLVIECLTSSHTFNRHLMSLGNEIIWIKSLVMQYVIALFQILFLALTLAFLFALHHHFVHPFVFQTPAVGLYAADPGRW